MPNDVTGATDLDEPYPHFTPSTVCSRRWVCERTSPMPQISLKKFY